MSAGYIGKQPTNNIFRKPGVWHSKEQFYHKKNENWDPEYTPGEIRNAFRRDFANTEEGRLSGNTDSLLMGDINVFIPETTMRGVFIGDSGSKIYVCGAQQDVVIQYEMSVPYDISTLDATKTKVRSLNDTSLDPSDIQFKPDGTKMYILDNQIDCVIESDVEEPWNILTANLNGNAFNFNAQEDDVTSVGFKTDGTKMYVLGAQNDAVLQYSLSTAWDVSTASYDSVARSVGAEADPRGMDFSYDGTKLYVIGTQDDLLRQYDMSPAWDLSTATNTGVNYKSTNFLEPTPRGISFRKDDMSQFWLVGDNDEIYQWSSPSGIASFSSYTGVSYEAGTDSSAPIDIEFEYENGTRFWTSDASSNEVYEWRCTEPWNTSSGTRTGKALNLTTFDAALRHIGFKTDGTRFFFTGATNAKIYQLDLTTPWDITSAIVATLTQTPFALDTGLEGFDWKPDGSSFYVVGTTNDQITQYDCPGDPWNVAIASTNGSLSYDAILGNSGNPRDIVFNEDGTRVSVTDNSSDYVNEFILTTPWDIDGGYTVGGRFYSKDSTPRGLAYGNDYKRIYVLGSSNFRICQFDLVSNKVLVDKGDQT